MTKLISSLLLVLFLAACAVQPSPQPAPLPTVTSAAEIPNTGATSAAPTLPPLPTAATPPTQPAAAAAPATGATATGAPPAQAAPACSAPAAITHAVTEGPFFKAGSPETSNLLKPGMAGVKLTLSGYVLTAACQPVAHALLDFWQADSRGQYDNSGYTLRGHQFTDAQGHYQLETIIPGLYPGRTEHIHVKVQASGGPVLTTQLFFPGVANNSADGIFDSSLLVSLQDGTDGKLATYTFIINPQ